jgi:hypothetical protein
MCVHDFFNGTAADMQLVYMTNGVFPLFFYFWTKVTKLLNLPIVFKTGPVRWYDPKKTKPTPFSVLEGPGPSDKKPRKSVQNNLF